MSKTELAHLDALWRHGEWADQRLLGVISEVRLPIPDVLRELGHVRGAQEVWLSRLESRPAVLPVWPDLSVEQLASVGRALDAAWRSFIERLRPPDLVQLVSYRTSAGDPYSTPVGDILLHMLTHGQYHRGKANAALRAADVAAVGVDYILWTRSARG